MAHDVIKQDSYFSSRSRYRLRFADAGGQASIECTERCVGASHGDGREAKVGGHPVGRLARMG